MDINVALRVGRDMIYLASCALHGRTPDKDTVKGMDFVRLYRMAKFHNMQSVVYLALAKYVKEQGSTDIPEEVYAKFASDYQGTVRKLVLFDIEREALCEFLGKQSWYLCLKGVVMQNYYPQLGMRQMADNDILIDQRLAPAVRDFLVERGYSVEQFGKGCHDTYFRGPLNFEIHRRLFSSAAKTRLGFDYYGRVKNMLLPGERPGELIFSDDDFYVYFMYHAYKHYATSGCGVRTLMDIFLYRSKNHRLNAAYIDGELARLGIGEYERDSRELAFCLFDPSFTPDGEIPEHLLPMLQYYITSGTFGTTEKRMDNMLSDVSGGGKVNSLTKIKYLLVRLFPGMDYYREAYPRAHKWIVTIPFLWLARIFRGIGKVKTITREVGDLKDK